MQVKFCTGGSSFLRTFLQRTHNNLERKKYFSGLCYLTQEFCFYKCVLKYPVIYPKVYVQDIFFIFNMKKSWIIVSRACDRMTVSKLCKNQAFCTLRCSGPREFKVELGLLLTVWFQTEHLPALCFSFLVCRVGWYHFCLTGWVGRLIELRRVTCLAHFLSQLGLPHNVPQTWWLKPQGHITSRFWWLGSPRQKCWLGWFFLRAARKGSEPGLSPWHVGAIFSLCLFT